jgi:hypothetical protein
MSDNHANAPVIHVQRPVSLVKGQHKERFLCILKLFPTLSEKLIFLTTVRSRIAGTKYVYIQSTTVYVPSSQLGLSHPLSRQRVCPSPRYQGGGHTRLRVRGWGSPNSDDWRKSLALCLLFFCDRWCCKRSSVLLLLPGSTGPP